MDAAEGVDRAAAASHGHRRQATVTQQDHLDALAAGDAVAVGQHGQGVGRGHRRAAGASPGRRPSGRATGRRRPWSPTTRTKWTLPSGRRRRASSATAVDRGPVDGVAVAHHLAQRRPGEQLEATPSTTPGCRAGRTPACPSTMPKASGLAGLIATCIQRMSPMRSSTTLTKSKSPMLTPPLVTSASHVGQRPARATAVMAASSSRDQAEVDRRRSPPRRTSAEQRRAGWSRGSGPAAAAPPPSTSSSPVESTPTRGPAEHRHALAARGWPARRGGRAPSTVPGANTTWPGGEVVAGRADVVARPTRPLRSTTTPSPSAAVSLDHHDGVGAVGHRRAGHDPDRLARRRPRRSGAAPGGQRADDLAARPARRRCRRPAPRSRPSPCWRTAGTASSATHARPT